MYVIAPYQLQDTYNTCNYKYKDCRIGVTYFGALEFDKPTLAENAPLSST